MPIVLRPLAASDLAELWDYIASDSADQADAFIDVIDRKFLALATRKEMGRSRPELGEGLRSFPVGRYVIFYRAQGDGIEVVRVLHSARELSEIRDDDGFSLDT